MTDLSPAALAVLDAFGNTSNGEYVEGVWIVNEQAMLAAALRAVADQVLPLEKTPWGTTLIPVLTSRESRDRLLAIAAELEGAND